MNELVRLTSIASSRKVLVLSFVRGYFEQFGCSPTVAEISAHQGISTVRVREVLSSLERDGSVQRIRGVPRGIVLPDRIALAIKLLRDLGWSVQGELRHVIPLPTSNLPLSSVLGQINAAEEGSHGSGEADGKATGEEPLI